jgi:Asp-tRNA(Asn)/Glu-tRNA(Gln) amidotransferase A subunit family amidase
MLSALRERRSSADDLVALHLRRIAAYGPRFNSFAALSAGAPAAARAADAARARG